MKGMRCEATADHPGQAPICACQTCGRASVKVYGPVLAEIKRLNSKTANTRNQFVKDWVDVCPSCDKELLAFSNTPFVSADGVMRTLQDYDQRRGEFKFVPEFSFSCLKFSLSALLHVKRYLVVTKSSTAEIEALGASLPQGPTAKQAYSFSKKVCGWGRGQRVWANLKRHNPNRLGETLADWLTLAQLARSPADAIAPSLKIKGLGISFASKHLRMLNPSRFATLDSVINEGLGYGLNPSGYSLFMRDIRQLQESLSVHDMSVADCEMGLFLLVRQHVRGKDSLQQVGYHGFYAQ